MRRLKKIEAFILICVISLSCIAYVFAAPELFEESGAEESNKPGDISVTDLIASFEYTDSDISASGTANNSGTITWTLYNDGMLVFQGSGAMKGNISPSNMSWYSYSPYVKTVAISEDITKIGMNDFYYFINLKNVYLPESLTEIGANAFIGCESLENINMPESVAKLGSCAFQDCVMLQSITIPEGITEIGGSTFKSCEKLTEIKIPSTVTSIGANAFYECYGLTEITIPDSVEVIYSNTFYSCSNVKSLYIGSGLSSIPTGSITQRGDDNYGIFYGMSSLESIVISEDNTTYDSRDNCNAIIETASNRILYGRKNSTIPDSVTVIGPYAFRGCSFTEFEIPEQITDIEEGAFYGSSLYSVSIPENVKTIEKRAFSSCNNLIDVYIYSDDVELAGNYYDGFSDYSLFEGGNNSSHNIITIYGNEGSSAEAYVQSVIAKAEASESNYYYIFKNLDEIGEGITIVNNDVTIFDTMPYYDGSAKQIKVEVYHNSKALTVDQDYTITFSNNVNAGQGLITVTGIGKYTGTVEKYFTIQKAETQISIEDCSYTFTEVKPYGMEASYVYPAEASEYVRMEYYTDEKCTRKLDSEPTEKGTYYVKAVIDEGDNWTSAEAGPAVMKISNVSTVILQDKTASYTGRNISIGNAQVIGSSGSVRYVYYTDPECTVMTGEDNGTDLPGGAPSKVGTYYVVAAVSSDSQYSGGKSSAAILTIIKAVSSITISPKTAYYNGNSIEVDTPSVQGSSGSIAVIYYTDENLETRTTKANSGAAETGGAPVKVGTYYVRASVASDECYERAVSETVQLIIKDSAGLNINTVAYVGQTLFYYNNNGAIDLTYNGFAYGDGSWWYVENGQVTKSTTGLRSGTIEGENAQWYVSCSKVNFDTTIVTLSGSKVYIDNGKADYSFTGFARISDDDWYVEKGLISGKLSGLQEGTVDGVKGLWFVKDSKVIYGKQTVVKYDGDRWYVGTDGKVNTKFNGIASNSEGSWFLKNGKVFSDFTGTVRYKGKDYTVTDGKAVLNK